MFDFAWYKTPKLVQSIFPSLFWKVDTGDKVIYPTFDDGPIPELTSQILKILNNFHAEATFFCVGDNIRKHPKVFNSILNNGHSVGNHTFNHLKAWKSSNQEYLANVALCQKEIEKHTSQNNKFFRFPYGQFKLDLIRELNALDFKLVMWDVLSKDYNTTISADTILKKSIQKTVNGSIIVFHDNLKAKDKILQFLPLYLKYFSDIGYKFKKL